MPICAIREVTDMLYVGRLARRLKRARESCYICFRKLRSTEERTCLEQGWSGTAPECVYTKCSELKIVENADVTIVGDRPNYLGSKVSYSCKEGYKPSGSLSRYKAF